jgi:hypothetical protein
MVHRAVITDFGCGPDDDAAAVIDEQTFADFGSIMDFNAQHDPHPIGYNHGDEGQSDLIKEMGNPIPENGLNSRIKQNDLKIVSRCRVAFFD